MNFLDKEKDEKFVVIILKLRSVVVVQLPSCDWLFATP